MTVQIVEIAGQKMAMLPVADYERLLEMAEDQTDITAAELAERRREEGMEYVPAELVNRILDGVNPLRVWRQYRSKSLAELAAEIGTTSASLSRIENGKQDTGAATWRALADALKVTVDDIFPHD